MPEKEITVRFLDVENVVMESHKLLGRGISIDDLKLRALASLNIEHTESTALDSWIKAMSVENGLAYSVPCAPELSDAIIQRRDSSRFMYWLA